MQKNLPSFLFLIILLPSSEGKLVLLQIYTALAALVTDTTQTRKHRLSMFF